MKVLAYGYGSMGLRHVVNARAMGHEVVVVETDDARRAAAMSGFATAFSGEPDAVIIATPASTHAPLMAKHVGCPMFVEKPMMLFEPHDMHEPSALVHVGYNLRFHEGVRYLRKHLPSDLVAARFCVSVDGSTWPGKNYADALLECSHEIDLALHLLGPATCAYAQASHSGRVWQIALSHERGVISQIHIDTIRRGYVRYAEVIGREKTLRWEWNDPTTGTSHVFGWPVEESAPRSSSFLGKIDGWTHMTADDTYALELLSFFSTVSGRTGSPACTFDEARQTLAICDAAKSFVYA